MNTNVRVLDLLYSEEIISPQGSFAKAQVILDRTWFDSKGVAHPAHLKEYVTMSMPILERLKSQKGPSLVSIVERKSKDGRYINKRITGIH
jgi:hypothetical protein